ncbi:hypothetical protein Zm00014a_015427 [Zea mays]|uniref:DUF1618 domain-containing protein n=1 Tax=Zea mays TaxID=4577 RepID=A0A3L6DU38_MAIZE|nr:hypothetical protein Zm00014a_015427 [Zea mays]
MEGGPRSRRAKPTPNGKGVSPMRDSCLELSGKGVSSERDSGLELSKSPPPPPAPWWTDPSAPVTGDHSWLILDRIVHRSRKRCGDATTSALAHECVGRPIRASLRIADPPAVSRLYVHWTSIPAIDCMKEPVVIAAHHNSILFRVSVPFDDPCFWSRMIYFPDDYFVYSSSSSPPSLTRLPPCFTRVPLCFGGGRTDPELDKWLQPHRRQQQRTMIEEDMGILCHGDKGEFTVADLTYRFNQEVQLCLLHHPPSASDAEMKWSVEKLQIPADMKISLYSFKTDAVVTIGERCLCWVDYYHGMLLIDVLAGSNNNSRLRYIPLPSKALKTGRVYKDGEPDSFRRLSVCDGGIIKLVCIITKEHPSPYPFTIETWTLVDIHQGRWEKDVNLTMGASEFFNLYNDTAKSRLPRVMPSFPVVSLVDPDVICFRLEDKFRDPFWMVQVNMRNKLLLSSSIYINEEEEEGYPPKRDCRNYFIFHDFIASKFSSYLSEDAIKSSLKV